MKKFLIMALAFSMLLPAASAETSTETELSLLAINVGKADALVAAANAEGGKDNITVVLLELFPEEESESGRTDAPISEKSDSPRRGWLARMTTWLGRGKEKD